MWVLVTSSAAAAIADTVPTLHLVFVMTSTPHISNKSKYRIGANRSPGLLFFRNLRWGGDSIREGLLFERGLYCFTCVLKVESTNTVFFSQFLHQIFTVFHSFFSQKLKKLVQNTSMYTKKVQEKNQENVSAKKSCSFKKNINVHEKKCKKIIKKMYPLSSLLSMPSTSLITVIVVA